MDISKLRGECEKCFGFCCVALYFSKTEGFPSDKAAGKPCINLQNNFRCKVHNDLNKKGLKGCIAYDCFGAGQRVAQVTHEGKDWINNKGDADYMYNSFLIMVQLHEMLWYLIDTRRMQRDKAIRNELDEIIEQTEVICNLKAEDLIKVDIEEHRKRVNIVLDKSSRGIRKYYRKNGGKKISKKKRIAGRLNLIGQNLKAYDLRGEDLRGALLIAADLKGNDLTGVDLIGADLRDADFSGADLSKSICLSQIQINGARGDENTIIPPNLQVPLNWKKNK